ncbi:bactofilin family protein [Motilimonas sp. 1_MG-2023]|uniref:bactofilin family protein n=1 Tax=Motilimonas TaxID=1914248 RepID=UPI0026E22600|nr:polymer-forming cytoskeletal protein [Motilimonas sp. 1_MG-2023]MDO6526748.1 polymer-forming cytoskeletal protein [Motilimonas sp. 1_MG-2023]
MFKKTKEEGLTYISENCAITGDLNLQGEVIINGTVEGNINCVGNVTLGRSGILKGVLKANEVFVSGTIEGETHCDILNIENKGIVNGELFSSDIRIDKGGQFFGVRKHKNAEEKNIVDFDKKPTAKDDKKVAKG